MVSKSTKKKGKTKAARAAPLSARRKKKPPGDASTRPSVATETARSAQVESPQQLPAFHEAGLTPTTSSLSPPSHNPYTWNSSAWPALSYASIHSAPGFSTVNPLPMYPPFAPTMAENYDYNGTPTTPVPQTNTTGDRSPRSRSESPGTGSETDDTQPRSGSSKRIRVSRRNPLHGLVEGAMVGNQEYELPRTRELRMPQTNASLAGRRFKRQMEDLICRAERLSHETECWLTLCSQRPGSGSTYHYTSPRFRREALDDASRIVSTFQTATYTLNLAKRKDAREIAEGYEKQLAEARTREKEAEKEVDEGRRRERELVAELEAQKAAVKAYRNQLALGLETHAAAIHPEPPSGNPV